MAPAVWDQIDGVRQAMVLATPWNQIPGLHLRLTGQLPSGKNRQGYRTALIPALTEEGQLVELPTMVRHPRQRFVDWRAATLKQLSAQLVGCRFALPFRAPLLMYVWYWPGDRRVRDRSGMLDAIFHALEKAGVVADDGLIQDPIWRTMPMDARMPRAYLVLKPVVSPLSDEPFVDLTSENLCPCCWFPLPAPSCLRIRLASRDPPIYSRFA